MNAEHNVILTSFAAIWVPEDSVVNPKKVSEVLAYLAYQGGAKFVGNCELHKVHTNSKGGAIRLPGPKSNETCKVTGIDTSLGHIECEYFVNCGGIWARTIGKMSEPNVKVPICPAEHYFLTFKKMAEVEGKMLPVVRDYDNHIYLRRIRDSFLMGAFEPKARPWKLATGEPKTHQPGVEGVAPQLSEEQWYHMLPFITAATNRMPVLKEAEYEMLMNTPDAFTPDGRWVIGEAPEVANYFVCVGMNGNSLQGAAGVGKAVADWMVNGRSAGNYLEFEVARFTSLHNNPRFLLKRTEEVVGRHYQLKYPFGNLKSV
jgi:pyruvate dehydrogenase phosphatase regulatory subunit